MPTLSMSSKPSGGFLVLVVRILGIGSSVKTVGISRLLAVLQSRRELQGLPVLCSFPTGLIPTTISSSSPSLISYCIYMC